MLESVGWFDMGPFGRLRAGSSKDSGPADDERLEAATVGLRAGTGRVGNRPLRKMRARQTMAHERKRPV